MIERYGREARLPDVRHRLAADCPYQKPGGYSLTSAIVAEVLLTFFFLLIFLGTTDGRAPLGFAPLAIGLTLTLIYLISIPITNASVNPARSTGPALFVGDWALTQLWVFWVAPLIGGVIGGFLYRWLSSPEPTAADRLAART
jgi:aquaporin Z